MKRRRNVEESVPPAKTSDKKRLVALVKLGAETLADSLIKLAARNTEVESVPTQAASV